MNIDLKGKTALVTGSTSGHRPREMIHYGTTKTAQLAVSRGLAEMTRGTAVTVNSVLPGPTMSEGVETFVKGLAKQNGQSVDEAATVFVKQFRPTSLLQRFATVEEIANRWSISPRKRRRRPMAQHFAPRAVSSRRLREVSDVSLCHFRS